MTTIYAIATDGVALHFDLDNLTPRQMEDQRSSSDMMGFLQSAYMALVQPGDHVMMYDAFLGGRGLRDWIGLQAFSPAWA